MTLLATSVALMLAASAGEIVPTVVQAPDSPVRVDHAKVFNVVANEPAVLMYAATNLTDNDLEQFTVIAFIFDAQGTLKARQLAPGRRTLEKRTTKVLDDGARRLGRHRHRSGRRRRQSGAASRFREVVACRTRRNGQGSREKTAINAIESHASSVWSTTRDEGTRHRGVDLMRVRIERAGAGDSAWCHRRPGPVRQRSGANVRALPAVPLCSRARVECPVRVPPGGTRTPHGREIPGRRRAGPASSSQHPTTPGTVRTLFLPRRRRR